jgi:hypothetical protein
MSNVQLTKLPSLRQPTGRHTFRAGGRRRGRRGVYLVSVPLIGVPLIGVHSMDVSLMGVSLIGVPLVGVSLARPTHARRMPRP